MRSASEKKPDALSDALPDALSDALPDALSDALIASEAGLRRGRE